MDSTRTKNHVYNALSTLFRLLILKMEEEIQQEKIMEKFFLKTA